MFSLGAAKNSCSACFLLSDCVDAGIVFLAGITMFVRAAILLGVLDDVLTAKTGVTCVFVSLQVKAVNKLQLQPHLLLYRYPQQCEILH